MNQVTVSIYWIGSVCDTEREVCDMVLVVRGSIRVQARGAPHPARDEKRLPACARAVARATERNRGLSTNVVYITLQIIIFLNYFPMKNCSCGY